MPLSSPTFIKGINITYIAVINATSYAEEPTTRSPMTKNNTLKHNVIT